MIVPKQTLVGVDHHIFFGFFIMLYYLLISLTHVKLQEGFPTTECWEEVFNSRDGVLIKFWGLIYSLLTCSPHKDAETCCSWGQAQWVLPSQWTGLAQQSPPLSTVPTLLRPFLKEHKEQVLLCRTSRWRPDPHGSLPCILGESLALAGKVLSCAEANCAEWQG